MIINYNSMASNALRQLNINSAAQAKSMAKLSSGLRINSAADDAAGLAISEKMKGQMRGLEQASRNAQDGISLTQTAEGALNETTDILQRMRELAVQSSNDTNTDSDRSQMQKEVSQLKSEIDRISSTTQFNTKNLLDGSIGQTATITGNQANVVAARAIDPSLSGQSTFTFNNVLMGTANFVTAAGVSQADVTVDVPGGGTGLTAGHYTLDIQGAANSATINLKDAQGNVVATASGADTTANYDLKDAGGNKLLTIAGGKYDGNGGSISFDTTITADITVDRPDGTSKTYNGVKADSSSVMSADGFEFDVNTNLTDTKTAVVNVTNNGVKFQIGANEGQTTTLAINKMDTTALKINNIDISTQSGAEAAITAIDRATQSVSTERAKLGAYENRLTHTINNLNTSNQNISDAQSRIADVDMASEMMNQSKSSVLAQAAQAMLAQANQQPQQVLQLLRG
jgi:flagellin